MLQRFVRYSVVFAMFLLFSASIAADERSAIEPDGFEPDGPANLVSLTVDGEPQRCSLHDASDNDWFVFSVEQGNTYEIVVTPEDTAANLSIGVYGFGWTTFSFTGTGGEPLVMEDVAYESYRPRVFGDGYTGYYTIQIRSVQ